MVSTPATAAPDWSWRRSGEKAVAADLLLRRSRHPVELLQRSQSVRRWWLVGFPHVTLQCSGHAIDVLIYEPLSRCGPLTVYVMRAAVRADATSLSVGMLQTGEVFKVT